MKILTTLTALALMFPSAAQAAEKDSTIVVSNDSVSHTLGEATVKTTRLLFVTKKDTLVYDIDALNTTKGDMLEDIINRLPGLELRDGTLYFKGKVVNRLQVNGTDFARGDTKTALSVLPAYIIKKVKAYEGQTDQHRITGIDDGQKEQVVDVILKKEYMGTWTGNADLGYGTDERWRTRMFANTFTSRMRISVYGGFTNIGQYQSANSNGNWNNNGGAGGSTGNTKYYQPGLSFMWKNRMAEDSTGFFKIEGNGGWDYRGHNDHRQSRTESFLGDGSSQFNANEGWSKDDEKIWRGDIYTTWRPWKDLYVNFNPSFAHQTRSNNSHDRSGLWNTNVSKRYDNPLDSLIAHRNDGWPGNDAVNLNLSESLSDGMYNSYSQWLYATQKLTEKNLRLSLRHFLTYNYAHNSQNSLNSYTYYQATAQTLDPLYNRYIKNKTKSYNTQTFLDFFIPLPLLETLRFTYGYEHIKNDNDQDGYRLEKIGGIFADYNLYREQMGLLPTETDWQQLTRDAEITLNSNTRLRRHWAEAQMQYNKHGIYVSLQNLLRFRHDELDYLKGDNDPQHPRRNATEYVLNAQLRYTTKKSNKYEVGFYHDCTPHDISNYVTIPDRSDPLNISLGNPDLKNQLYNSVYGSLDFTFPKNRFARLYMQANWYKNFVVTSATYDKTSGVTTSQPVNMSGRWSLGPQATFGTPIGSKQKINFYCTFNYNFNHTPGLAKATEGTPWRRTNDTHSLSGNLSLSARWTNFNLSLAANTSYSRLRSTDATVNGLDQWHNEYRLFMNATLPWDLQLKNDFSIWQHITAHSQNNTPTHYVWNLLLSKSFLREKNMSVQLECSDILNQRRQTYSSNSAESSSWYRMDVVQRFFMVHLVYNFSTKKKS